MRNETRELFNAYCDRQAELNGVHPDTVRDGKAFSIDPTIQQKLNDKQQEDSSFLNAINIASVDELKGEALGLGIGEPLASRTNTSTTDRAPVDPSGMEADQYECAQTNSDTAIKYKKLDQWAKFADFQVRISNQIRRRQALDRILVGFNGTHAAAATNRGTYPRLQDVNIGWIEKVILRNNGARALLEGPKDVEAGKIVIGPTGDYKNVHALVKDACHGLLPEWADADSEMVAILGRDILHDIYFPLVNQNLQPTETLAADLLISAKTIGGRKAVSVPGMRPDGIFITRLDNLSIYEQDGKRRRTVVDNAKRDQVETYESSNDAFVIEDFDFACYIGNVKFQAEAEA